MPITVIVRSPAGGEDARLTFDGAQRVVIGRGASSDIRLPDPSVSHRHAILRAQGADFVVVDEGSMNGTFVGDVRVAARTSRIVRPGNTIRVGRIRLDIKAAIQPVTRDLALATRDLALALVARALEAVGTDPTVRVRVVEGRDQGKALALAEEGREYVIGRGPQCDLPLADADASREHVRVMRREETLIVRDLGTKNGSWLGPVRIPSEGEVVWRSAQMLQIGQTVLALEEPMSEALSRIESAADEAMDEPAVEPMRDEAPAGVVPPSEETPGRADAPAAEVPSPARLPLGGVRWSWADGLVMVAALVVLALSLGGIVWLLRG